MKKIVAALIAALLLLGFTACDPAETGGTKAKGAKKNNDSSQTVTEDDVDEVVDEEPEEETYHPDKSDFQMMLKVTSKQCFGSAGCNLEYKVGLRWLGPSGVKLDKAYDVYYRVTGGDMGGSTDTIRVSPNLRYSVNENFDSTGNVADKLTASVIRIGRAGGF